MTHDQGAQRAVLNYLRADNRIRQQSPKRRRYRSGMYRSENREGGGALFKKCSGGQELEDKGEPVKDEEYAELGSAHGGLAARGDPDEVCDKKDAQAAGDDVGDVGERSIYADEEDGTLRVHADRSKFWICRRSLEDRRVVMLQLMCSCGSGTSTS